MPLAARRPIACILIASLAVSSGVGEGLHWIPGCGHGIPVGNTVLLLGVGMPDAQRPADGRPHVERPQGRDVPVYDEDQCAICSVVGQSCTSADSVQFVLVVPLVDDLPPIVLGDAPATIAHPFQARAPPLV